MALYAINHCDLSGEIRAWHENDREKNDIGKAVGARALELVGARLTGGVAGKPSKLGGIELMARRVANKAIASRADQICVDFDCRLDDVTWSVTSVSLVDSLAVSGIRVGYDAFAEQVVVRSGKIVSESVIGKVTRTHANSRIELFARAVAEKVVEQGATAVASDVDLNLDELQSNVFGGFKWPKLDKLTGDDFDNAVNQRALDIVLDTITGKKSGKRDKKVSVELAAGVVAQNVLAALAGKPIEPPLSELTEWAGRCHISSC